MWRRQTHVKTHKLTSLKFLAQPTTFGASVLTFRHFAIIKLNYGKKPLKSREKNKRRMMRAEKNKTVML